MSVCTLWSMSEPMQRAPKCAAAIITEPVPTNGSQAKCPGAACHTPPDRHTAHRVSTILHTASSLYRHTTRTLLSLYHLTTITLLSYSHHTIIKLAV